MPKNIKGSIANHNNARQSADYYGGYNFFFN